MIQIITRHNLKNQQALLQECYQFRHEVFTKELGWKHISGKPGLEIDEFDTENAVHIASIDNGKVVGYSRLLPSTEPHLLSHVFSQLATHKPIPTGTGIYEWTRYCVAKSHRGGSAISKTASELICGTLEYCEQNYIHTLTAVYEAVWITRFLEIGFDVAPLGLPQSIDGSMIVGVRMDIQEETLNITRHLRGMEATSMGVPISYHS